MSRRSAGGLHQTSRRTQEPFLVSIEDGNQRHLGNIQPFPQQVDAHEYIELALAQCTQNLDSFDRANITMQITDVNADVSKVVGQLLGSAFGQCGHKDTPFLINTLSGLLDKIVDLAL